MGSQDRSADSELVKGCLTGSERAWNLFYQQYHGLIETVVGRYAHYCSAEDHKDVCQDVYGRLVKALEEFSSDLSSLRTFVAIVARNTCIDWLRGKSTMSRAGKNEPLDHHGNGGNGTIAVTSEADPPDAQLLKAQETRLLMVALNRLKEGCRKLIKLRYYDDLTYKEMAVRLGKTKDKDDTVNGQTLRCIAQLKAVFDELQSEGLRT